MNFTYSKWLGLPINTRHKIAEAFGFKKVRPTHVSDNVIVDDGYIIKEIENALTVESMQKWLNNPETDPIVLFQLVVDTLEGKTPKVDIVPDIVAVINEPLVIEGVNAKDILEYEPGAVIPTKKKREKRKKK